ncbi:hypothetical protein VP01_119g13 [Puccinia sorghi]|uniref:Uncharacterized protein n=1 Tax=Puccinia sorghi TaxID=27349 RepID=A0A0L6VQU3_9BASI|nr:hypothetical protein VP01_119g13 [Puccinia sorghi]
MVSIARDGIQLTLSKACCWPNFNTTSHISKMVQGGTSISNNHLLFQESRQNPTGNPHPTLPRAKQAVKEELLEKEKLSSSQSAPAASAEEVPTTRDEDAVLSMSVDVTGIAESWALSEEAKNQPAGTSTSTVLAVTLNEASTLPAATDTYSNRNAAQPATTSKARSSQAATDKSDAPPATLEKAPGLAHDLRMIFFLPRVSSSLASSSQQGASSPFLSSSCVDMFQLVPSGPAGSSMLPLSDIHESEPESRSCNEEMMKMDKETDEFSTAPNPHDCLLTPSQPSHHRARSWKQPGSSRPRLCSSANEDGLITSDWITAFFSQSKLDNQQAEEYLPKCVQFSAVIQELNPPQKPTQPTSNSLLNIWAADGHKEWLSLYAGPLTASHSSDGKGMIEQEKITFEQFASCHLSETHRYPKKRVCFESWSTSLVNRFPSCPRTYCQNLNLESSASKKMCERVSPSDFKPATCRKFKEAHVASNPKTCVTRNWGNPKDGITTRISGQPDITINKHQTLATSLRDRIHLLGLEANMAQLTVFWWWLRSALTPPWYPHQKLPSRKKITKASFRFGVSLMPSLPTFTRWQLINHPMRILHHLPVILVIVNKKESPQLIILLASSSQATVVRWCPWMDPMASMSSSSTQIDTPGLLAIAFLDGSVGLYSMPNTSHAMKLNPSPEGLGAQSDDPRHVVTRNQLVNMIDPLASNCFPFCFGQVHLLGLPPIGQPGKPNLNGDPAFLASTGYNGVSRCLIPRIWLHQNPYKSPLLISILLLPMPIAVYRSPLKIYQMDFNRNTSKLGVLDNLVPQVSDLNRVPRSNRLPACFKERKWQAAQADQPTQLATSIGGLKSIVRVHCLSWNKTITRASILASGLGCGFFRVDFVEGGLNNATANINISLFSVPNQPSLCTQLVIFLSPKGPDNPPTAHQLNLPSHLPSLGKVGTTGDPALAKRRSRNVLRLLF